MKSKYQQHEENVYSIIINLTCVRNFNLHRFVFFNQSVIIIAIYRFYDIIIIETMNNMALATKRGENECSISKKLWNDNFSKNYTINSLIKISVLSYQHVQYLYSLQNRSSQALQRREKQLFLFKKKFFLSNFFIIISHSFFFYKF